MVDDSLSTPVLKKDVEEYLEWNSKSCNDDTEAKKETVPSFRVVIGSEDVQSRVVGFPFCRGAIACGIVPSWSDDETWLMEWLKSHPRFSYKSPVTSSPLRVLALDGICDNGSVT